MKKFTKLGLTFGLTLLMTLTMATFAFAVGVPDAVYTMPGVPQSVGIPDKPYDAFSVEECRGCHLAAGELTTANLHHNTTKALTQGCVGCHPVDPTTFEVQTGTYDPTTGKGFDRTCTTCHESSWHHTNPRALGGNCTFCHDSNLIADAGTGWVAPDAPTYAITDVTPRTTDCNNCHIEFNPNWGGGDKYYSPNGTSHHATVTNECGFCHDEELANPAEFLNIRTCEGCHTITTLHTIKGHTEGSAPLNNSERCLGCHGAYMKPLEGSAFQPLPPAISSVSKSVTVPYEYVTVYGQNFGNKVKGITAKLIKYDDFGLPSTYDAPIVNIAGDQIQIMIPAVSKLGIYDLVLANAGGKTGTGTVISVTKKPIITQLSPSVGKPGDKLVISGSYFNNHGNPVVKMAKFQDSNPYILTPVYVNGTLEVTVPANANGTYNVSVTNDMGQSNLVTFTIGTNPKLTSVYPTSASVGKTVNIFGSNLIIGKTNPTVMFGTTPATKFASTSATQVTVFVPTMAKGATKITLSNNYGNSNQLPFTVK